VPIIKPAQKHSPKNTNKQKQLNKQIKNNMTGEKNIQEALGQEP
jgi:hypothetical protein